MTGQPAIPLRAWGDLALLALLWGAIFLFIALALREMTPLWLVFFRVAPAAAALWLVAWMRGERAPRGAAAGGAFLVMGLLNNLIPFGLITWGQQAVESGLASILNGATAVFGILVAAALLRDERLTARRLAGALLGLAGIAAIVGPEALAGFDLRSLGQIAILGAALSYAFAGVWAKTRMKGLSPLVSAAGMLTASSFLALPAALLLEGPPPAPERALTFAALAYISLAGTAGAYLLYYRVLAAAGSGNLMLVTIVMPPISVALGALVLGERLAPGVLLGAALILLGLAIIDGRLLRLLGKRARAA
ncbi:MAG: DMT family transporter [Pikeienuella sp.]|uniref:DMT family transporter n=1 Tax=Pikeienuella sp. TaxID=2831957 RepID=UPI00391DAAD4